MFDTATHHRLTEVATSGGFAVCVFVLLSITLGLVFNSIYVGVAGIICGCCLAAFAAKIAKGHGMVVVACLSYATGMVVASLIYQGYISDYGVPYWVPGSDDMMLENDARQCVVKGYYSVYDMLHGDMSRERLHNTKGYVIFLSYLMRAGSLFGGYHTMVPRIINIFLLNVVALFIVRLYLKKFSENQKEASRLYCLVALFPNSLYIASHVYRDVIAAFLLVLIYYFCVREWRGGGFVLNIFAIAVVVYCAYWVRESIHGFACGIMLVSFAFRLHRQRAKRRGLKVRTIVVALVSAVVVVVALIQFQDIVMGYLTSYTERLSEGNSGVVARIYSLPLIPFGIPARFMAYLITPFYYSIVFDPSQWFVSTQHFCNVLISLGTVYLVSQYVYLAQGFKADRRTVLVVVVLVLGIALTTFGFRHVVMVYPFIFLALAEGRAAMSDGAAVSHSKASIAVGLLFVVMFCALYII